MQYSIAIADDHLLIAKALTGIIENFRQYNVLYEVSNGKELMEKMKQPKNIPEIVLLDVTMPVMDGFETAQWLKEHHPEILIMALSMQDEEQTLIKMIRCGARGYLHKNVHPAELEKALDTLVSKGYYYPDWAASKLFSSFGNTAEASLPTINAREIEFLNYAATELTYKEIAAKMFCSPRTVESYRDSLFEKLSLKTRVGLVVFAMKNGILKL
jgi:DNA-binding NarL/FixJ family response regulator